jgi:hypothetical protein
VLTLKRVLLGVGCLTNGGRVMAQGITGYWKTPMFAKNVSLAIAAFGFLICVGALHDAYDVRGTDRPFLLKIVGMPQL